MFRIFYLWGKECLDRMGIKPWILLTFPVLSSGCFRCLDAFHPEALRDSTADSPGFRAKSPGRGAGAGSIASALAFRVEPGGPLRSGSVISFYNVGTKSKGGNRMM